MASPWHGTHSKRSVHVGKTNTVNRVMRFPKGGAQRNGCSKSSSFMCYWTLDPSLSMAKGRGVLAKASWGKATPFPRALGCTTTPPPGHLSSPPLPLILPSLLTPHSLLTPSPYMLLIRKLSPKALYRVSLRIHAGLSNPKPVHFLPDKSCFCKSAVHNGLSC